MRRRFLGALGEQTQLRFFGGFLCLFCFVVVHLFLCSLIFLCCRFFIIHLNFSCLVYTGILSFYLHLLLLFSHFVHVFLFLLLLLEDIYYLHYITLQNIARHGIR